MTKFSLDRPAALGPFNHDGTDRDGKLGLDMPRVTRDEALELMAHHLQLAAMYYEATPHDEVAVLNEVTRLMKGDVPGHIEPAFNGAVAFLEAMNRRYALMKRRDAETES